jgi:hypothetical protein
MIPKAAARFLMLSSSIAVLATTVPAIAQPEAPAPPTAKSNPAAAALERHDGLMPVLVEKVAGKVFLVLPPADKDGVSGRFIYQASLTTGLGSTPIGLDRAETGRTQVLAFRRIGKRAILQAETYAFRAEDGTADEKAAVAKSFSTSNIWSGDIEADGRVDITSFLMRDALDIAGTLRQRKQGAYRAAPTLSYVDVPSIGVFPENIEIDTAQTFSSDEPGPEVRAVAPDPRSITLTVHHTFVKLPEPGFKPRRHDPRTGTSVQVLVNNYAAPLDAPIVYRLARRFRLEKTDPGAARSRVKKPIVFYVDRAAPEPIRSALVEGAGWWSQAFEAAGFIDAFRVEVLPEGVSPMDARYNVINWIHRQTRGWSTGQTIVDPRTGEIVRGVVQLGSLRVRQDKLIFEGLLGADKTGKGGPDDPVQLALARVRQLGMHETGHTLGFSHNFAGSTFGDRASTLDYPAPLIRVKSGKLDVSDAYVKGAGDWDRFTVKWLYSQFAPGVDEKQALDAMARAAEDQGMRFIADTEHPLSTQWDNGSDPVAGLENVMAVRRIALDRFGLRNIVKGAAVADLRRVIVPIYLYHRYQVDGAIKQIGGVDYSYAVAGDGHEAAKAVAPAAQRRALAALIKTLDPSELDLRDDLIDLLSNAQSGTPDPQFEIELFPSVGGSVFDLPSVATTAADITLSGLLDPERLNRLAEQHRRDPAQMSVTELVAQLTAAVGPGAPGGGGRLAEIRRRERARFVGDIVDTLADKGLSPTVAAELRASLAGYGAQLDAWRGDPEEMVQTGYLAKLLLSTDPTDLARLSSDQVRPPKAPPGAPIG